jgi:3-carboxy-cis,cis-muconate cycloisomerase
MHALIEADVEGHRGAAAAGHAACGHAGAGAHADAAGVGHQLRPQVRRLGRAAGAQPASACEGRAPRAERAAGRGRRHARADEGAGPAVVQRVADELGLGNAGAPGTRSATNGWRWAASWACWWAAWARSRRHFADGPVRSRRTGRAHRAGPRRLFGHAAQAQPGGVHGGAGRQRSARRSAWPRCWPRCRRSTSAHSATGRPSWPNGRAAADVGPRQRARWRGLAGPAGRHARMRANIDTLRAELPREAADEWFDPALAGLAARPGAAPGGGLARPLTAKEKS